MRIYLAHPISGLSGDQVFEYYERAIKDLAGFEILYPMIGKEYLRNEAYYAPKGYKQPCSTDHAIHERDRWMVTMADIVFIDFTGAKSVSIGCCMELAWADLLGKHTIIVMDDPNPHKHAFVVDCADIVFETYAEAVEYLRKFAAKTL